MAPALITALHVITLLGSATSVQSNVCQPPLAPTILAPTQSTQLTARTPFILQGDATTGSIVTISINTNSVATATADSTNHYASYLTIDSPGTYRLSVSAQNPCGATDGGAVTVNVSNPIITPPPSAGHHAPPALPIGMPATTAPVPPTVITSSPSTQPSSSHSLALSVRGPADGSTTSAPSIFITGSTSEAATETISVNGAIVASSRAAEDSFGFNVPLSEGKNTIIIRATGNAKDAIIHLTVTQLSPTALIPWYQTRTGGIIIGALAVAAVAVLFIIFLIGIVLL